MAATLKSIRVRRHGGTDGKDKVMWVFDGEEWTQDDGGYEQSSKPKQDATRPQWPVEMGPELQVIEIVQPVPTTGKQIPVPLP